MLHPLIELNLNLVNTRLGYLRRTVVDVKLLCSWRDTKSTIWEVYSVSQNESKLLNGSELWFVLNSLFPSKRVKFYIILLQRFLRKQPPIKILETECVLSFSRSQCCADIATDHCCRYCVHHVWISWEKTGRRLYL